MSKVIPLPVYGLQGEMQPSYKKLCNFNLVFIHLRNAFSWANEILLSACRITLLGMKFSHINTKLAGRWGGIFIYAHVHVLPYLGNRRGGIKRGHKLEGGIEFEYYH